MKISLDNLYQTGANFKFRKRVEFIARIQTTE